MEKENLLANYTNWQHIARGAGSVIRRLEQRRSLPFEFSQIEETLADLAPRSEHYLDQFYPSFRRTIAAS